MFDDNKFENHKFIEDLSKNNFTEDFLRLARDIELTKYDRSQHAWRSMKPCSENVVVDFLVPPTVDYLLDYIQNKKAYNGNLEKLANYLHDKRDVAKNTLVSLGLFGFKRANVRPQVESDLVNYVLMRIQEVQELDSNEKNRVVITPYRIHSYFKKNEMFSPWLEERTKEYFREFMPHKYIE